MKTYNTNISIGVGDWFFFIIGMIALWYVAHNPWVEFWGVVTALRITSK